MTHITAVWPFLCFAFGREHRWLKWIIPFLIGLIALDRVYCGVHYSNQVVLGVLLGLYVLCLAR
jgi:membrane-associated phospholipid phosphatase